MAAWDNRADEEALWKIVTSAICPSIEITEVDLTWAEERISIMESAKNPTCNDNLQVAKPATTGD